MRGEQLTIEHALEARDDALERVGSHADAEWKAAAFDAVRRTARLRETFTVDDVWPELRAGVATHENRAMGAVLLAAARLGWIESTGTTRRSTQRHCHANPRTVWRSRIAGEAVGRFRS